MMEETPQMEKPMMEALADMEMGPSADPQDAMEASDDY